MSRWRLAERSGLGVVVLVLAGGAGSAVAAATVGSVEILDNSIRSRDIRDGSLRSGDLAPSTVSSLRGPAGPTGPPGPSGAAGPKGEPGEPAASGSGSITQTVTFYGPVQTIAPNSGAFVFAGPPAQVATTATYSRVVATAMAPLGYAAGSPAGFADLGMCFQPSAGGVVKHFYGNNFSVHGFSAGRLPYTATGAVVLPPGSYLVGMCVRNNSSHAISNNNYVNGYAQVTR